jgi:hypothetical protein
MSATIVLAIVMVVQSAQAEPEESPTVATAAEDEPAAEAAPTDASEEPESADAKPEEKTAESPSASEEVSAEESAEAVPAESAAEEVAPTLEPVEEASGEMNLHVAQVEETYVPSSTETALVMGSLYTGTMLVLSTPALLPGGGKWMGAVHLGLAASSVVYAENLGWKLIGGASFTALAAINLIMDMRGVEGASVYTTNMGITLGVPLILVGTYMGLELWGESASTEDEAMEPALGPEEAPVEEPAPETISSLHLSVVPIGGGALTSLTFSF